MKGTINQGDPLQVSTDYPAFFATHNSATTLNADGSRFELVTSDIDIIGVGYSPNAGTRSVTTTANGLAITSQLDIDGNGTFDNLTSDVVAVGGSRTQSLTFYNVASGELRQSDVLTTSIDGRTESLQRDSNGDGSFDHFESSIIRTDGGLENRVWNTTAVGALTNNRLSVTSDDGLTKTIQFDSDGDGDFDQVQNTSTALNTDGSRVTTMRHAYGNGVLLDETIVTVSANGLLTTTQIDLNGDGATDETSTEITTINADGSTSISSTVRYADLSLKESAVTTTTETLFGSDSSTLIDSNGDGLVDRTIAVTVFADGSQSETLTYSGANPTSVTTTISADGSTKTTHIIPAGGVGSAQESFSISVVIPDSNGSRYWRETTTDFIKFSSHTIDEAGIDTWVWIDQSYAGYTALPEYNVVRIDVATEAKYVGIAERLFDTVFDREMMASERELLGARITANGFDVNGLTSDLLASTEFNLKYGALSNAQFIERIYQNALGRAASMDEIASSLAALTGNTTTRGELLQRVSESAEHLANGNDHAKTSNTAIGQVAVSLDHITQKDVASDIVSRLYNAALARPATATEAATQSNNLVSGVKSESVIASDILALPEFVSKYGALSNAAFVSQLFQNALQRAPSSAESKFWTVTAGAKVGHWSGSAVLSRGGVKVGHWIG